MLPHVCWVQCLAWVVRMAPSFHGAGDSDWSFQRAFSLVKSFASHRQWRVRLAAISVLAACAPSEISTASRLVCAACVDAHWRVREAALRLLDVRGEDASVHFLHAVAALCDPSPDCQAAARTVLSHHGTTHAPTGVTDLLVAALGTRDGACVQPVDVGRTPPAGDTAGDAAPRALLAPPTARAALPWLLAHWPSPSTARGAGPTTQREVCRCGRGRGQAGEGAGAQPCVCSVLASVAAWRRTADIVCQAARATGSATLRSARLRLAKASAGVRTAAAREDRGDVGAGDDGSRGTADGAGAASGAGSAGAGSGVAEDRTTSPRDGGIRFTDEVATLEVVARGFPPQQAAELCTAMLHLAHGSSEQCDAILRNLSVDPVTVAFYEVGDATGFQHLLDVLTLVRSFLSVAGASLCDRT